VTPFLTKEWFKFKPSRDSVGEPEPEPKPILDSLPEPDSALDLAPDLYSFIKDFSKKLIEEKLWLHQST
jgi:hypothetical protein